MGHQSTLSIDGTSYLAVSEALAKTGRHAVRSGMRGVRSEDIDDVVDDTYDVGGVVVFEPNITETITLLGLALGTADTNTLNTSNQSLNEFTTVVDRVGSNFTYAGCKVNRLTLRGQVGGPLRAEVEIWGKTEVQSGTAPAEPASLGCLLLHQMYFNLDSTLRNTTEFVLVIDNMLERAFYNSQTATRLNETGQAVTLETNHPFTSAINTALYNLASTGISGVFNVSNTASKITFTAGKLQVPDQSPTIGGKGEVILNRAFVLRKDGSTHALAVSRP
jgi:hypothetical protein